VRTRSWQHARLAEHAPASAESLASATAVDRDRVERSLRELVARGLVVAADGTLDLSPSGRRTWDALVSVRRATLEELVRDWSPEDHQQLQGVLDRLARSLASEMPSPA
jgi:DNA-binding MarR family transcriptional regulator